MSLNYELGSISRYKEVCLQPDGRVTLTTELIIHLTMSVDLGEVTLANILEWLTRLEISRRALQFGPFGSKADALPLRDVKKILEYHVGLKTSVITRPRKEWLKRVMLILISDAESSVRTAMKEVSDGLHDRH